MSFQYHSNRQDFLIQQLEEFFKSLQSLLIAIGKVEGRPPLVYYDELYKAYFEEERSFFVEASPEQVIQHFEDMGFPGGLELVARLLYETGKISEDATEYFQKAAQLFDKHLKVNQSLSMENVHIYTSLKEMDY